ncbi:MAG: hypothetical protein KDC80_17445 [Saprospiraceae bacterium]|nr:hypothetical protein [Saprospiraceae bacterium]
MKKFFLLLLILVTSPPIIGQELDFNFTRYNTSQGLSSNDVSSIVQDARGFLWIGGIAGLQRFDGTRFVSFSDRLGSQNQILLNPIEKLVVDSRDRLWLLLSNGKVARIDADRRTCIEIKISPDPDNHFHPGERDLFSDSWDNIFILDIYKELLIYDEDLSEFRSFKFTITDDRPLRITGIASQPGTGDYWIAFENEGLFSFQTDSGKWSTKESAVSPWMIPGFPRSSFVYGLFVDSRNRLWAQEWLEQGPVLWCFDLPGQEVILSEYPLMQIINSYFVTGPIFESSDGHVWIGGANIFVRYNEEKKTFQSVLNEYRNDRSIYYKVITCIYGDSEDNIWIGTNNNGIYRFNPFAEYFTNVVHINRRTGSRGVGSPMSFMDMPDSTTLVATWGDGLYRYDRHWQEVPLRIENISDQNETTIWCMMKSPSDSLIWMCQQPAAIWSYDPRRKRAKKYETPILKSRSIRQMAEDRQENFWLGIHGTGLYHWKRHYQNLLETDLQRYPFISDCIVNKVLVDREGLIWVATDHLGLYVLKDFDQAPVMHFGAGEKEAIYILPENGVSAVLDYNDSIMIFATSRTIHLFNRKENSIKELGRNGMIKGFIAGLIKDREGFLWVTSSNGLYRINVQTRVFLQFDTSDGIEDTNFTLSSVYEREDGSLVLGGSEEFVVFDPAKIEFTSDIEPQITISDLRINSQAFPVDSILANNHVQLRYNQNALEIDYTTLTFSYPYLIRYKMEGLDQDWRTSNGNSAIYSYLPPGDYNFTMMAEDPDGIVTKNRSIAISIRKPVWKTWWFYCSLGLLGFTILYFFDRERIRRKEQLIIVRNEIAQNLHGEINSALSSINILSEVARIKVAKDPTKAREYLDQIRNKSQTMLTAMDDILWSIDPKNDSMVRVINRLEMFVAKVNSQNRIKIDFLIDPAVNDLKIEMKMRQVLVRLFKGTITNLAKIGANQLHLHLRHHNNYLEFLIEFEASQIDLQLFNNMLQRQDLKNILEENRLNLSHKILRSKGYIQLNIPFTTTVAAV